MRVTIKTKTQPIIKDLVFRKIGKEMYSVLVDKKEIGTVYKGDAQVNNFRRHFLDGTKIVERWFAKTTEGVRLGENPPYEEGCATRREATIELFEHAFGVRRDPKSY
jgi:hypothetical protein